LVLHDGASYVVETKLGAETKLLDAMVQLYDYSKHVGEAKGAFAVLFPEELRRPWPADVIMSVARDARTQISCIGIFKDLRPSQQFRGSLYEVADWIAGHVLRALVVEADTGFAIRVLREVVDYISAGVRQLQGRELEDIFGGKSVFENVLQYEEGRYPLEEMRHAAAYLLVNQLLFYHVLTRVDASFPVIDEDRVRRPGDLRGYFEPVLRRDYSSVFGFDVASRLPDSAVDVVRKAVVAVKALAPEKIRHDLLGKVFHELIPFEVRKAVAAFYTNNEAAEILAQLAIDRADAKVLDLACGSGTLLVAAYRRKRKLLLKEKGEFTFEDHKRFLEEDLTGIDIMPFAAHMAVVHLALQALAAGHETEKVRIAVWDSTELEPGQTIPAISRELKAAYRRPTLELFMEGKPPLEEAYVEKGAVTLEGIGGEQIPLEKADVVIMNPPFTRQERLPKEYKNALAKRLKGYEKYLHGQLGLYGYFVLLADKFVKNGGRIALVLPATILRLASCQGLREFLVQNYQIEYIITTTQRAAFSESAQFREILLVAKKSEGGTARISTGYGGNKCAVVNLKRLPKNVNDAKTLAEKIKAFPFSDNQVYDDKDITIRMISQNELQSNIDNLFKLLPSFISGIDALWDDLTQKAKSRLIPLQDYLSNINGSIVRGVSVWKGDVVFAPHMFIMRSKDRALKSYDLWCVEEETVNELFAKNRATLTIVKIPKIVLAFGLRRLSGISTLDITNHLDYVVIQDFTGIEDFVVEKRVLENLPKWRDYAKERLCYLAIAGRYDISASGTNIVAFFSEREFIPTQMFWAIRGLGLEDAKIIALWMNSTVGLLQLMKERKETRGPFIQILAYALKRLQIINLLNLSKEEKELLLNTFNTIKKEKFPSILRQLEMAFPARKTMDKAILKLLGYEDDQIEQIIVMLYSAIKEEIDRLKQILKGK
jgi:tRNA1(Val) A37 N6-methylase TrmN6/RNAse (barnase) inhibitor barstar